MVRSEQLARDIMYSPGMNNDTNDAVSNCTKCQMARNYQHREPLVPSKVPATNLLYCNNTYFLAVIDYFSDFIKIEELEIDTLREKLLTDNGSQFSSHLFKVFKVKWVSNTSPPVPITTKQIEW